MEEKARMATHTRRGLLLMFKISVVLTLLIIAGCGGETPTTTTSTAQAETEVGETTSATSVAPSSESPDSGSDAEGSDFSPALQELIPTAEEEGEVLVFTKSSRYTSEEEEIFTEAFNEHFGFDNTVNVRLLGLGGTVDTIDRVQQELETGIPPSIDVGSGNLRIFPYLDDFEFGRADVDWEALGIPEENYLEAVNAPLVETSFFPVAYNTDVVSADEAPTHLEDLLDPNWQGDIVTTQEAQFPTLAEPILGGSEAVLEWTRGLVEDQDMAIVGTMADGEARIVSGEFPIGYGIDVQNSMRAGAPVNHALVQNGGIEVGAYVIANAQHPAAARLYAYWWSNVPEGQALHCEILGWCSHTTEGSENKRIYEEAAANGEPGIILLDLDWINNVGLPLEEDVAEIYGLD